MASFQQRKARWREVTGSFIHDRLKTKLDKLQGGDLKREELLAQHQHETWIEDAARRVSQIQAVTHSLKPIHPDARGTNLYVEPGSLPSLNELGSHALGRTFAGDVVGNAAALDVYKFLKLEVDGVSLLAALLADDEAAVQALHDDPEQARAWRDAFVGLTQPRAGGSSSHTRAKQLYWLMGSDPGADGGYELLAPLFATSLAHAVHAQIQEDRFGEANKAARAARRERKAHDGVFHDYPGLAVQRMGGTKPQNISQLNSERGGVNYLLASLPPDIQGTKWGGGIQVRGIKTVFSRQVMYLRPGVRAKVRAFRIFLESYEKRTMEKMDQWDQHMAGLLDEVIAMACSYQYGLPVGWSADKACELPDEEKLWLDPFRGLEEPEIGARWLPVLATQEDQDFDAKWTFADWPKHVAANFGNFLSAELEGKYIFSDVEHRQWVKELLKDERIDSFAKYLHRHRVARDTFTGVPTSKTHAEWTGSWEDEQ